MFRSIVVPIDYGPDGDRAAGIAGILAERARLPVELLTVSPPGTDAKQENWLLAYRQGLLGTVSSTTTVVVSDGDTADTLVRELERRPDALAVMGTKASGPISRMLLGNVTESVLSRTDLPVLAVGPHVIPTLGSNLVVAVADANAGAAVLPSAVAWARGFGFDVCFVQVVPTRSRHWWSDDDGIEVGAAAELASTARALGVEAAWDVLPGDPADAVPAFLRSMGGGVIAVASHRWADDRHLHRASTARSLVHRTPFPVLVQPVHDRALV
jgi:nucleotide-binding universal stress UspA family protein